MTRRLTKYVLLTLLAIALLNTAAGVQGDRYVNNSEPAFLHDIGPQDERADNPLVAIVASLVVTGVILRGLREYRPTAKDN